MRGKRAFARFYESFYTGLRSTHGVLTVATLWCRFVLPMRLHGEAHVRRAVAYALLTLAQAAPRVMLTADLGAELPELCLWLAVSSIYKALYIFAIKHVHAAA